MLPPLCLLIFYFSPLPLRRLHRRAHSAALISPLFLVCFLLCAAEIFTFSLAFSSLFPVPAVLTVPCYFPPPAALIGWLFVCTNPCSRCLTTVISVLPHSPPSCLHLDPAHMFGNLSLRSTGIIEYRGDGLQDCQPFSAQCLTHHGK